MNSPGLVRAIGRWSLTALVVNGVIGSGIFGLPDDVARYVGQAAPLAYIVAAAGIALITGCFAEVASQFREAGGPYLYARKVLGRFVGIQMGWFAWLVRLTSAAANANLFVVYLGAFVPTAAAGWPRIATLTLLIGLLGLVNVRGVRSGTRLNNAFLIAKLLPLMLFIAAGLALVGDRIRPGPSDAGVSDWLQAILVLIFAFGGFETAVIPMGEAKAPRRDAPFALFVGLGAVTALYLLVQLVVMAAVTDPSLFNLPEFQERPVGEAARVLLGPAGGMLVGLGVLLSTYGYLSGQFVAAPRLTYALAEQEDFPSLFRAVHPRFRTPYVAIVLHTLLVWGLAVWGTFLWNALFSAVARLFTYASVCAVLLVLRSRQPAAAGFRLPGGSLAAAAGIGFCILLVMQMGPDHFVVIALVTLVAAAHWQWARRRSIRATETRQ